MNGKDSYSNSNSNSIFSIKLLLDGQKFSCMITNSNNSSEDDDDNSNNTMEDDGECETRTELNGVVIVEEKGGMNDNDSNTTENNNNGSSSSGRPVLMKRFASLRQNLQNNQAMARVRTSAVAAAAVAATTAEAAANRVAEEVKHRRQQQQNNAMQSGSISSSSISVSDEDTTQSSSFHGRYRTGAGAGAGADADADEACSGVASQAALALAMSGGNSEMQEMLSKVEDGEYSMVLGTGMLGVNLKQCLQLRNGVYVDFLVTEGAAHKSQVIHVGDALVRVNHTDVSQGTIHHIPTLIAKAKRPALIVLSRKFCSHGTLHLAIGLCLKLLQLDKLRSQHCVTSEPISQTSPPQQISSSIANACSPSMLDLTDPTIFAELNALANDRCNESLSLTALSKSIDHPPHLALLKQAFLDCCADPRKISFLAKHFANEDSYDQDQDKLSFTLFKLFLRLFDVLSLLPRAPPNAQTLLIKDFITQFKPLMPLIDIASITTTADAQIIISKLEENDNSSSSLMLQSLQTSILGFLAASRFARFLVSNQCARMRAYLRGTAPFYSLPLHHVLSSITARNLQQSHGNNNNNSNNIFLHILLHSICYHKKYTTSNDSDDNDKHVQLKHYGPAGICCAISIRGLLQSYTHSSSSSSLDDDPNNTLLQNLSTLWKTFLSPKIGSLDDITLLHSQDTLLALKQTRILISSITSLSSSSSNYHEKLKQSLHNLANQLIFDYANHLFPIFKDDDFYETFCREIPLSFFNDAATSKSYHHHLLQDELSTNNDNDNDNDNDGSIVSLSSLPLLNEGCISRLLRNTHLPDCISIHRPHYTPKNIQLDADQLREQFGLSKEEPNGKDLKDTIDSNNDSRNENNTMLHESYHNADFAIIFGSSNNNKVDSNVLGSESNIRRFGVIPLGSSSACNDESSCSSSDFADSPLVKIKEHEIPSTFESYAVTHSNLFGTTTCVASDGWEMSLINFIIPNSTTTTASTSYQRMYGVSLIIRQVVPPKHNVTANQISSCDDDDQSYDQILSYPPIFHNSSTTKSQQPQSDNHKVDSPCSFEKFLNESQMSTEIINHLNDNRWSDSMNQCAANATEMTTTIGISFISARPVIPAMRSSLSSLARITTNNGINVKPLVDILGAASPFNLTPFFQQLLKDHIVKGSEPFLKHNNLSHQIDIFQEECGMHLIQSLPPMSLSLLFLLLLLEQKVVLASERRSLLLSASFAIVKLLGPLEWSHLNVSYVPTSLANDLVHYPAPFLIGVVPSEERELLDNLPDDVTLVDLDSSVITLANDMSSANYSTSKATTSNLENTQEKKLKAQLHSLSKRLGHIVGQEIFPSAWCCDSINYNALNVGSKTSFFKLKSIFNDFIIELLEGTSSCCYWIEEQASPSIASASTSTMRNVSSSNPSSNTDFSSILFDEDRFYQIKDLRYQAIMEKLRKASTIDHSCNICHGKSSSFTLALDVVGENFILDAFLRCQGLSTFISSSDKESMIYW